MADTVKFKPVVVPKDPLPAVTWTPIVGRDYIHTKTAGVYTVLHLALNEADLSRVVVYQSKDTGDVWVRPLSQFADGRFVLISLFGEDLED